MDKLTQFKEFVKENPSFAKYVRNNEMTWQKFYELYDLYGSDNEIWNDYRTTPSKVATAASTSTAVTGFGDLLGWLKNIDLDSFQDGISSIQRVLGVLQEMGSKDTNIKPEYKPRPLYKHFED